MDGSSNRLRDLFRHEEIQLYGFGGAQLSGREEIDAALG
jgi:hypothetical protein